MQVSEEAQNVGASSANTEPASKQGIVFMASGQGSQKPGMGASLLAVPEVAETFACASDVLGKDIAALITAQAPETAEAAEAAEALNETRNAQAAIATLSIGIGRALQARGIEPAVLLGFSLGQISALALASMVSLEDAFRIIDVRSSLMNEAAQAKPGAMSALLKADPDAVAALCETCAQGQVLVPANYNSPGQIVISGEVDAITRAEEAWKAQGGRASRLATQGAFHSPLMQPAAVQFAEFLQTVDFADPQIPVLCNTDANYLDKQTIRQRLADHLTHPVLFDQSVQKLRGEGYGVFAEIGFGGVLQGLVKRIDKDTTRFCIQDEASMEEFVASCQA